MTFATKTFAAVLVCTCVAALPLHSRAAEPSVADLVKAAQSGAEAARVKAIDQLAASGSKAAEAAPALIQLLSDKSANVRAHAAHALGKLGEAGKPAAAGLAALAKDDDETVRRQAIQSLIAIRPGPQIMVPLFTRLLEDSDPAVQARIMHAIAQAGPVAVPGLIQALNNEKADYWACVILREIGPDAKDAIPVLVAKLKDPRPEVRREAALALGAMGPAASSTIPQIAALLDDEHAASAATMVLGQIGQIPADAEAKVRANAKGNQKLLSTVSSWALARVHPDDKALAREAAEQLVARLSDPDPFVRVSAARALSALKLSPEITLPIMEKALANADETTAQHALEAVAALGPTAVPRLLDALKHERLRPQIAYILGQIGPAAAPAAGELAKMLASKENRTVREAAIALGKIGPAASSSVPDLVAALKQSDGHDPHAIMFALGKMGPAAMAAKSELAKQLASKEQSASIVAASALIEIDGQSSQTVAQVLPVLTAGLASSVPEFRQMSAEALARLKSAAKPALPALEKAAADENPSVREAVKEAIAAIR